MRILAGRSFALAALMMCIAPAAAAPAYQLVKTVPLGSPDRWDYVVADAATGRVYIAHGDRLAVLDAKSATVIGNVEGIEGGTHGTAISASNGRGYTDDGRNGQVVAFDLKSLKIIKLIPADQDADGIAADPATGHIFVIEGDPAAITVIDPTTNNAIATIKTGEKMEYAVAGEPGVIYVAGEAKRDLLKIDTRTNRVVQQWPTPDCASPHGLAYDGVTKRLFMGCVNAKLMVVDAASGQVLTELAIGRGSDAIAFDPKRKRIFSSNGGDGTVTIYQQSPGDHYDLLDPLPTAVSGRTMAVDAATGRLFVVAADTQPNPTPGGRPRVVPGTARVLVFDAINTAR